MKLASPRHEAFSRVDLCVALGTVLVLSTLFFVRRSDPIRALALKTWSAWIT